MLVALALVCMSFAVLKTTNVPPNSTENDDTKGFNISSTVGNLLTTISLDPEILENLSSHSEEADEAGCKTCNSTVRQIPGKMVMRVGNTSKKLPAPTPPTNCTSFRRKNRVSSGTTKCSKRTVESSKASERTSTARETITTKSRTDLFNTTKFQETTNTVMAHAMSSLNKFLNDTESTNKSFRSTTTTPSYLGKISISTKVMAHLVPLVTRIRSLMGTSIASRNKIIGGMTAMAATHMGSQLPAVAKSNADKIMTPLGTTNAINREIPFATTNSVQETRSVAPTNIPDITLLTKTTNMAGNETTEEETNGITHSTSNNPLYMKTTEQSTTDILGTTNGKATTVKSENMTGGETQQEREKVTGKTTKESKISRGKKGDTTNAASMERYAATKRMNAEKAPPGNKGVSEMTLAVTSEGKETATDIMAQVLVIFETTTKNGSAARAGFGHGFNIVNITTLTAQVNEISDTTSSQELSTTDASTSEGISLPPRRKTSDEKEWDASGMIELPYTTQATSEAAYEDETASAEDDEEVRETTTDFSGPSIWASNWPYESTTAEKGTDKVSPATATETTTQNTSNNATSNRISQTTTQNTKKLSTSNRISQTTTQNTNKLSTCNRISQTTTQNTKTLSPSTGMSETTTQKTNNLSPMNRILETTTENTNIVPPINKISETTTRHTSKVSPSNRIHETTTLNTNKVTSLNKTPETPNRSQVIIIPKSTPSGSEEMAPPASQRSEDDASHQPTTEEARSLGTKSVTVGVSHSKGKVRFLPKSFLFHSLERNTASDNTNSAATPKSHGNKTDRRRSRHSGSHDRKKGTQSPSPSGFSPSKKQRKSLFRKNKNSETTPIKS